MSLFDSKLPQMGIENHLELEIESRNRIGIAKIQMIHNPPDNQNYVKE